jgi:hypothetical protein
MNPLDKLSCNASALVLGSSPSSPIFVVINQRVSGYSETLFSFDDSSMVAEGSQER